MEHNIIRELNPLERDVVAEVRRSLKVEETPLFASAIMMMRPMDDEVCSVCINLFSSKAVWRLFSVAFRWWEIGSRPRFLAEQFISLVPSLSFAGDQVLRSAASRHFDEDPAWSSTRSDH